MNEIKSIVDAYQQAKKDGKRAALATVVKVDGSSYRRPGARMLVTEDGQITGAISGGCLEGDALKKALFAMSEGRNKLVTYDSTDEDDLKFGVQLGCNGIVYILFEPLGLSERSDAIQLLRDLSADRVDAVVLTLFSLTGDTQPGTCARYSGNDPEGFLPPEIFDELSADMKRSLTGKFSATKSYILNGQSIEALIEFVPPPLSLVIAGAGNDVQPLVSMASILGWMVTVVDGRPAYAQTQRFPLADRVITAKPHEVLAQISPDPRTVFLFMTHNYNYDVALFKELAGTEYSFIGILGPAQKKERMLKELQDAGIELNEKQRGAIYGPVGLDIGAETAEEIGLSILAEIKAVFSDREGSSLKQKEGPIHNRLVYAKE